MEFIGTRGAARAQSTQHAVIQGLAPDGGLFVPSLIHPIDKNQRLAMQNANYMKVASTVLQTVIDDYDKQALDTILRDAYVNRFDHNEPVALRTLDSDLSVLELWHGPTCAFKDMALAVLPGLMTQAMRDVYPSHKVAVATATSGDTGKAAMEGFADVDGTKIIVFYPHDGVSDMQKMQMVTQRGNNVCCVAIEGNFDDAQNGVKAIFSDAECTKRAAEIGWLLSSANSINWGRLAPQIAYYFSAYAMLCKRDAIKDGEPVNFAVPTGNFGNILAGYYAKMMGLPIGKLILASNANRVLSDFLQSGLYDANRPFYKTLSPSMDILISSNLERLLFELCDRDGDAVRAFMQNLKTQGTYQINDCLRRRLDAVFYGDYTDDHRTRAAILHTFENFGYLIDPHTATAMDVLERYRKVTSDHTHTVVLSTASAYKFADAVLDALVPEFDVHTANESQKLQRLQAHTDQPIPSALLGALTDPVRHTRMCKKEDMPNVLYEFLQT